jgi:hypothetical protein
VLPPGTRYQRNTKVREMEVQEEQEMLKGLKTAYLHYPSRAFGFLPANFPEILSLKIFASQVSLLVSLSQ